MCVFFGEEKKNQMCDSRHREWRARAIHFTTLHTRVAQNLASNFLGRLARASLHIGVSRGAHEYIYCRPTNMFFHTRRFREPERRYRTESLGDTLRLSCRSSSLGRPRRGDSFARDRLEGQGHFNPPTILRGCLLKQKKEEGKDDDDGASERVGQRRRKVRHRRGLISSSINRRCDRRDERDALEI